MSKILITGAAGFIGSHLVEHLLEQGIPLKDLRLFVPPGETLDNLPKKEFEIFWGDVRNKEDVKKAMDQVKVVYHLAAKTFFEGKTYEDFKDTNVDGTSNLLTASKDKNLQKFVLFSSISVYGLPAYRGDMINCDETWEQRPLEAYGESKLAAEKVLLEAHAKWGIPYVIIRPTTVYGPRDKGNLTELARVIKKHLFFFIGKGENLMDYVYVKDLVRGVRLAQKSKAKTADYIFGGVPIKLNEVVKTVAQEVGEDVPSLHCPRFLGLILSYPAMWLFQMLSIRPIFFPRRVKVMTASCYFSSEKAAKELGYKCQVSFKEGVKEAVKWMKLNNF